MSSSIPTPDTETGTENNHWTRVRSHALAALSETDADGEAVKTTVLHALYFHQSAISLGDILELNAVVPDPESGPLNERVNEILTTAVTEYGNWADTTPASQASESTFVLGTEDH